MDNNNFNNDNFPNNNNNINIEQYQPPPLLNVPIEIFVNHILNPHIDDWKTMCALMKTSKYINRITIRHKDFSQLCERRGGKRFA